MRLIRVRLIVSALVLVTSCGDEPSDPGRIEVGRTGSITEVTLVDGTRCVVYTWSTGYAGGGGISCDWGER